MPPSRTLSPPAERHAGDSVPALPPASVGRERLDVLLIGVAGFVRLLAGAWLGFRPFDDTYITFRYALNVASGLGFVYNAGEPVLGTTTPLWTLVLSGLRLLGAPLETASLLLSLGLDAVAALLMYDLLRRLGFPRSVCLAGPLLFLTTFDYLSLSRSGMESALFVALTIATLHAIAVRRFATAGFFCALACLTRPEGVALGLVLAIALWRARGSVTGTARLRVLAVPALVLAAWAIFALVTFGSVVPQSVVAKAASSGHADLARFSRANLALFFIKGQFGGEIFARSALQLSWVMTLLAGVAVVRLCVEAARSRPAGWERVLLLIVFPACYVGALALAHAFTFFPWYYAPIYPFLAMAAGIGLFTMNARTIVVAAGCAALVGAQLATAVLLKLPADRSFWVEGYLRTSQVVPARADVSVAALEIGAVGWRVWPARVIDLEGLVTPDAVGVRPEEHVRRTRPQFIVLRTDNAAEFLDRVEREAWFADRYELVSVLRDPYVAREFRLYRRRDGESPPSVGPP